MGALDTETMEMAVIDITPTIQKEGEEDESAEEADSSDDDDQQDWFKSNELAIPARPKLDIEMPYRSYKLVYTNGQPVERVDKHPFCMSRVYYDGKEQPNEVDRPYLPPLTHPQPPNPNPSPGRRVSLVYTYVHAPRPCSLSEDRTPCTY